MTSPVDFISGPRTTSTPGNFANGKTASLTATYPTGGASVKPRDRREWPSMALVASFASGRPIVFDTNGTVREARGFTSRTKVCAWRIANCTLMRPTTPRAAASAWVCSFSARIWSSPSEYGGSAHAASPECTPAFSMCSMTPPTTTASPSAIASTSTSVASSRNLSTSTGCSGETRTASRMYSCRSSSS